MHKYLTLAMFNYINRESFPIQSILVQITLQITMDTDPFECKLLFQEYFMKLPVVNRSFFLFFFCFFPLFLSPVASEETITQLVGATSKIKLSKLSHMHLFCRDAHIT